MEIAVYGGSFNPPHVVHAMVASWLLWTGHAEQVWLVPVFRHAFEGRHGKQLASYEDRVRWCEALALDLADEAVQVCTIESHLPAPSFTIDTLRALASRHPGHRFRLVVGADVLGQLDHWREWDSIARDFSPIIVGRQGQPRDARVQSPDFPGVSSTEVRLRLAAGLPVDDLLTRHVRALISPEPV